MKKMILLLLALLFTTSFAQEPNSPKKMPTRFQAVPFSQAQILQKGEDRLYCKICGMTLPMFYKTNHAGDVNGTTEQYCSIHCLAESMSEHNVTNIKVVDVKTLKFIDAKSAWYVVGSTKAGTMSKVSKYAFSTKEDAQAFAKKFSGDVKSFDEVLKLVQGNLAKESGMIHKKQAMMAKKGKMMFSKMCKPVKKSFGSVAEAKAYVKANDICGNIKGKKLQAIALYLNDRNSTK